ncbi:MAG TPA: hypothetical protein VH643_25645, partial [Gemmataceae bacterium]
MEPLYRLGKPARQAFQFVLSVTFEHSGSQIKQAGSEVLKLLPLRLLSHSRSDFFAEDFPLQCP